MCVSERLQGFQYALGRLTAHDRHVDFKPGPNVLLHVELGQGYRTGIAKICDADVAKAHHRASDGACGSSVARPLEMKSITYRLPNPNIINVLILSGLLIRDAHHIHGIGSNSKAISMRTCGKVEPNRM